jgi:predicted outer membrane protein
VSTQIDAARIATARSTDRDVKAFAERVASDDAKVSAALRAASPRGVDVPKNDPDVAALDSVKNLRGADFDKAYIEQVALGGGQKTLSAFQAEIASGRNEPLKDAARKALPTIQQHYAMAQELAKRKHLPEGAQ